MKRFSRPVAGVLLAAYLGFLWCESDQPGPKLAAVFPGPSGNFAHAIAHAILAILLIRALVPWQAAELGRWPGVASLTGKAVLGAAFVHGIIDETHQFFVPGRTCSVYDIVIDLLGALVVLVLPRPRGPGRPVRWWPAVLLVLLGAGFSVLGWKTRPFPDRLLEDLLSGFFPPTGQ